MQNLTKKTFIATEALLYIACHNSSQPVRSKDICKYMDVTLRYLEQILQALVSQGVLKGVRGPKGGYILAKERRKIMVSEVYSAIKTLEGEGDYSHSSLAEHIISPLWSGANVALAAHFSTTSIQDLCDQTKKHNVVPCSAGNDNNFVI
jgi:Rrf2 family protein